VPSPVFFRILSLSTCTFRLSICGCPTNVSAYSFGSISLSLSLQYPYTKYGSSFFVVRKKYTFFASSLTSLSGIEMSLRGSSPRLIASYQSFPRHFVLARISDFMNILAKTCVFGKIASLASLVSWQRLQSKTCCFNVGVQGQRLQTGREAVVDAAGNSSLSTLEMARQTQKTPNVRYEFILSTIIQRAA
jgi:hypothetical protein